MNFPGDSKDSVEGEHEVQLLTVGGIVYGVFNECISAIVDWIEPAPLPHAPAPVLGVVSVQGRMLTVLDLADFPAAGVTLVVRTSANKIIALKGDEQLALAVDTVDEKVSGKLKSNIADSVDFVLGTVNAGGREVSILNVDQLFAAAIQGRERRRRRF